MTCANCGNRFDNNIGYGLADWATSNTRHSLCCVSCLVEFAWKLREQQTKLSKSTGEGGK